MGQPVISEEKRKLIEVLKQIPWTESELNLLIEGALMCSDEKARKHREALEYIFEGLPQRVKMISKLFDEYLKNKKKGDGT